MIPMAFELVCRRGLRFLQAMKGAFMSTSWKVMEKETLDLLASLVQANTTNPPGNEILAAEVLRGFFARHGVDHEIIEPEKGRANVIAEVGEGDLPPLYLVSHLDVVAPGDSEWKHDPFGAEIADGQIWGRGTIDTKQVTAIHAMIMAFFQRHSAKMNRRMIFLATADEERGSGHGMEFLVKEYPNLFVRGYALTEGGGFTAEVGGNRVYLLGSAQKGTAQVTIRSAKDASSVHPGFSAGGSDPLRDVLTALDRIYAYKAPVRLSGSTEAFFDTVACLLAVRRDGPADEEWALNLIDRCDNDIIRSLLREAMANRFIPNYVRAGDGSGSAPGSAEARIRWRILPSYCEGDLEGELEALLGDLDVMFSVDVEREGHDVGLDNELYECCCDVIAEMDPGSQVMPFVTIGNTDGRFLEPRGIASYDFAPHRGLDVGDAISRAHGVDERLSLESLRFGLHATVNIVAEMTLNERLSIPEEE